MGKTCEICGKIKKDSQVLQSESGMSFCCQGCFKKYDIVKCRSCSVWERREKMTIASTDCIICSDCKRMLVRSFFK